MTWGKVSDDLHGHPKWTAISPNAKALWSTALSYCNAYLTNGVVTQGQVAGELAVKTFGARSEAFELFDQAAAELVRVRLWQRKGRGWAFHQFVEHNPPAEDEKLRKWKLERSKRLHRTQEGKRIKATVIVRDCNRCRYCGVQLASREEREYDDDALVRTFDHVDPNADNSVENVVLACPRCNGRKNGRSLDEAGMALLSPGDCGESGDNRASPRARRARGATGSALSHVQGVTTGRVGSGRVGSGEDGHGQGAGEGDGRGLRVIDGGAA